MEEEAVPANAVGVEWIEKRIFESGKQYSKEVSNFQKN
jgi:hypothetical protein